MEQNCKPLDGGYDLSMYLLTRLVIQAPVPAIIPQGGLPLTFFHIATVRGCLNIGYFFTVIVNQ